MNASSDHNLLFGMLALQIGFVTQQQLIEAMNAWCLEKSTPLGEILRRRGLIDDDDRADVEKLLAKHVRKYGDVSASLAALPAAHDLRAAVTSLDGGARHVSLSPPTAPPSNDSSPPTLLPGHEAPAGRLFRPAAPMRYVRLRPHARGGLGEVSVALDEELGREVALKEIQERYADHPDSRARFVREAEVTGHLEHPGVVPVYGLGAYADGRPYYAMRFIRGESMHEAIKRFHDADKGKRDPGERSLALRELLNRFVAVCDAVAYAHARGVIHRDLKPANVMLGEYGETLVVDWGLARLYEQDDPLATAPAAPVAVSHGSGTATQLGQAVGTPAFMAPEQARGEQNVVGPASDVFSLGAILYEQLTGRPPYAGSTAAEVLALACEGKVVPARQRKPDVARALEAVCARAMASAPAGRYSSARALADEVRRWLADEPVEAYREPLLDRARRWGRRHRTLATTGLALLATGALALGVVLWAVNRERVKTERALERALVAEEGERKRAVEAEENLVLAREAIDEVFVVTRDDPSFQQPRMEKPKRLLLRRALPFYRRFLARRPDDPELQRQEAEQWYRVGEIEALLGREEEAIAAFERAREACLALAASHPDLPRNEAILAASHNFLGSLLYDRGKYREAARHYEQARRIRARLAAQGDAKSRNNLAATLTNLGQLFQAQGRHKEALAEHQQARRIRADLVKERADVPLYKHGLARTHIGMGVLLAAMGKRQEAFEEYEAARDRLQDLARIYPHEPDYRANLARVHLNRGNLYAANRKPEDARREYDQGYALQERVVAGHPDVPAYGKLLALIHTRLGALLRGTGKFGEAHKQYGAAFAIREQLARDYREVPAYQADLALSHYDFAHLLIDQGQVEEGLARFRKAQDILRGLIEAHPEAAGFRNEFARYSNDVANRLMRRGRNEEARREYRKALDGWQELAAEQPEVVNYRRDLGVAHHNLGVLLTELEALPEAEAEFRRALAVRTRLAQDEPDDAEPRDFLADTHASLAGLLATRGKLDRAGDHLDQAWRIRTGLHAAHRDGGEYKLALAQICLRRGSLAADHKRLPLRLEDLDLAIALAEQVRKNDPNDLQAPNVVRLAAVARAEILDRLGGPERAAAAWEQALKATPLSERGGVRLQRALSRARCGDDRGAAAEVAEFLKRTNLNAETLYKLACVQALNAGHAARQVLAPLPERQKRSEGYAKDALALLQRAADAGFFRQPMNAGRLNADSDLTALRERDDFKRFVTMLGEKS